MSKWTSEEVRKVASYYKDPGSPSTLAMLTAYAERIAADEAAVPDGYTALLSDGKRYWSDRPGEYGDWKPYFLSHPPAQPTNSHAP